MSPFTAPTPPTPITPLLAKADIGKAPLTLSFSDESGDTIGRKQANPAHPIQFAKYQTDVKTEAFIGPLPHSLAATINLLKDECPSLSLIDPKDITVSLHVAVDAARESGTFRIMSEAWPAALTEPLPMIKVDSKNGAGQPPSTPSSALPLGSASEKGTIVDKPKLSVEENHSPLTPIEEKVEADDHIAARSINLAYSAPISWNRIHEPEAGAKTWDDLVKEGALLGIH
ncbi:hypothetical protein BD324DRAFT_647972 [Kockovaella imperatae]|uniref:Uncharacterized protein n=1 Tax=Kockovaella imperatae TaxID=4999 RepID=A0A1Y1UV35_9TREE|nr:hypothetical protein BD324DRAFT_647972 [Kockovaella imperatae]ORX41075.1 hypothetical protein BD324DRAFT_647972 [Kockovaella imperatae]